MGIEVQELSINEEYDILCYIEDVLEIHHDDTPQNRRAKKYINGKLIELNAVRQSNRRKNNS